GRQGDVAAADRPAEVGHRLVDQQRPVQSLRRHQSAARPDVCDPVRPRSRALFRPFHRRGRAGSFLQAHRLVRADDHLLQLRFRQRRHPGAGRSDDRSSLPRWPVSDRLQQYPGRVRARHRAAVPEGRLPAGGLVGPGRERGLRLYPKRRPSAVRSGRLPAGAGAAGAVEAGCRRGGVLRLPQIRYAAGGQLPLGLRVGLAGILQLPDRVFRPGDGGRLPGLVQFHQVSERALPGAESHRSADADLFRQSDGDQHHPVLRSDLLPRVQPESVNVSAAEESSMTHVRYALVALLGLLALKVCVPARAGTAMPVDVQVNVDARSAGKPFPHFWEEMFGSGRAVLALRDDYRADLSQVERATGFTYVRAHGILDREVGVFHLDKSGHPVYNFSYVDQIYDGLLARGVKPFVELSFMPPDLDSHPKAPKVFFYHLRASPPKSYPLWDDLIRTFARHLVQR